MSDADYSLPPGPGTPTILQLVQWYRNLPALLESCHARYGDTFTIRMPVFGTFVVLSAPEDIEMILRKPAEVFSSIGTRSLPSGVFGPRSLAVLEGPDHGHARRLLGRPLKQDTKRIEQSIQSAVGRAVAACPAESPVPLRPLMERISFEVIARTVVGLTSTSQIDALMVSMRCLGRPMIRTVMERFIPWMPPARGRREAQFWIDRQIAARRSDPRRSACLDILDVMLASRDSNGEPWSDSAIRDNVMMLLIAGHGSMAAALGWTLLYILRDSTVRARMEAEIAVGGNIASGTGFEYVDAVIKEALRIRPAVPLMFRRLAVPMEIGRYRFPAGVTLAPSIHLVHRRPDFYPKPERFDPDRFLHESVSRGAWIPLGGGHRHCLGAGFAFLELRAVIAALLRDTNIRLADIEFDDTVEEAGRITRAPTPDLKVVFGCAGR